MLTMAGPPALPSSQAADTEVPSAAVRADHRNAELECMTADQLASLLGVDRKTVYEYAARRVIPCRRLGRRVILHRPTILAWLAQSSTTAAAPGRR
jgi:excisionase family DNA binding protein